MNPMAILSMKDAFDKFQGNHPKFMQFVTTMAQIGLEEGTVLECNVLTPEGKEIQANIKINQDDLELIDKIKSLKD